MHRADKTIVMLTNHGADNLCTQIGIKKKSSIVADRLEKSKQSMCVV